MTVADIIDARSTNALGEALSAAMQARGMKQSDLARELYGSVKRQSDIGKYLNGRKRPGEEVLGRLAEILGVAPEPLRAARDAMPRYHKRQLGRPPGSPNKAKALPHPERHEALPVPEPERVQLAEALPQFSLVIDQSGRATLLLNLVDVPMQTAMRAMAALTGAGILKTEGGEG